jgi:hypothetical protein
MIKKTIRTMVLVFVTTYLGYCVFHFLSNDVHPTYVDCGKVISKSADEIVIKYGTKSELYLNIQFDKTGFKSIECDPTTYFSKKVGERVCFNLHKQTNTFYEMNGLIGFITLLGLASLLLFLFVAYLFNLE